MRASQLYAFADLDVGLPKVVEADERTIDSLVEPSAMQPNENVDFAAVQGLVPPPGWKIGMPVELQGLPSDLPPPPPGWKIGDPIPLPPTGAFAPKADELPPRPVAHMPLKAPEPIQVRFVQLDINPDQDDDSIIGEIKPQHRIITEISALYIHIPLGYLNCCYHRIIIFCNPVTEVQEWLYMDGEVTSEFQERLDFC
ncbi:Mediator of rna polymerase ii transcription subunit [Thalictrum thalictroides]|uniref:Mediator of rna polymerase ii transcription subunit n=1 Tax=Thalictrum thalictroides TaxID=46969 RepID=A0A7J6VD78_THATH|nr:Mediator of rna polymerase ii transcription subunit [Thalictrum thalictroides]